VGEAVAEDLFGAWQRPRPVQLHRILAQLQLPSPKAAPVQSQELIVWTDPSGAGQPFRA